MHLKEFLEGRVKNEYNKKNLNIFSKKSVRLFKFKDYYCIS